MALPASSICVLIEVWMAREVPDEILADGLEEFGRADLGGRLRRMGKLKGARRKTAESKVTREIIYMLPRSKLFERLSRGR